LNKIQSMYRSKFEIERKLKQLKFAYSELKKFENRVFVNNGIDPETGCNPLELRLGTFLIYARSIFQYAWKEVNESKDISKKKKYNDYISKKEVIKFFKDLRDSEIHSFSVSAHVSILGSSPMKSIDPETGVGIGEPFSLEVEALEDINSKEIKNKSDKVKITHNLMKRIEVTSELIKKFEDEGNAYLAEAAKNGEDLYESQDLNGESNVFTLAEAYLSEIEKFVDFGKKENLIT